MKDDLFNYLVATDTLDDFLGNDSINVYQCGEDRYIKMKVIGKYKYLGGLDQTDLIKNKIYYRVYREDDPNGFYIVDDSEEDYLSPDDFFEKVDEKMGTYERESKLEDRMIDQLRKQGYQYIEINDVTELEKNFREQVNLHNRAELKFKDLSDKEFERLMVKISGKGVFQSAKELRQKQDIQRDDGSIVYIELFNTKDWCRNNF